MKDNKKIIEIIVLAVIVIAITVGIIIYIRRNGHNVQSENNISTTTGPISYSLPKNVVSFSQETKPFSFTAAELEQNAKDCGTKHEAGYFEKLAAKFKDSSEMVYIFKYQSEGQAEDTFIVTLLPNKAGYTSLDQFNKDFDFCAVAGDAYPKMLNSKWLLFVSSCGSGGGGIGEYNCDQIEGVVEPSLKFN